MFQKEITERERGRSITRQDRVVHEINVHAGEPPLGALCGWSSCPAICGACPGPSCLVPHIQEGTLVGGGRGGTQAAFRTCTGTRGQ